MSDKTISIPDQSNEPDKPKTGTPSLVLTFVGLQVALFLSVLDNTIISTALPRIGSDFDATSTASWVATAYMLTFDAFQPLFSKLSDIFGRKVILLLGIVLFLLGSVICGAANTIAMLIGGRAVAGIGGAGITAMVFIVIADIVPLEKRAAYQGLINAVFAVSSVLGPLIGGTFTDYVTWRWNFYINLPIGAVALAMITFFLRLPTPHGNFREKLKRIDYFGTAIVLAFATLFLLALNFGGQMFPWASAAVIVPLVLSGLLVILLGWVEIHVAKEPLMPPRLFKNRSVVSILLVNWFFGMAFISAIYFLPVYFQVVRQDSAMWSGIRLIPMQLVLSVISLTVGLTITKTGFYRPFIWVGMTLATLWIGLTALYDQNTPFSKIYGITIVGSAGLGTLFVPTLMGLQAAVEPRDIAVVTGLGNFSRILGGALGVAISSAVLNSYLHQVLFQSIPEDLVLMVLRSSEYVNKGLPEQFRPFVVEAYVQGLRRVWFVLMGLCGCGLIVSFFVKHHPLRLPKKNVDDKTVADPEKNAIENKTDEVVGISDEEKA
ncbi:major facilitator superfamily domain-containing protein [Sporodiniella umbellata]|nr:major facilitator superfamily domain-containing protein [Sporodiniella umbellata]